MLAIICTYANGYRFGLSGTDCRNRISNADDSQRLSGLQRKTTVILKNQAKNPAAHGAFHVQVI